MAHCNEHPCTCFQHLTMSRPERAPPHGVARVDRRVVAAVQAPAPEQRAAQRAVAGQRPLQRAVHVLVHALLVARARRLAELRPNKYACTSALSAGFEGFDVGFWACCQPNAGQRLHEHAVSSHAPSLLPAPIGFSPARAPTSCLGAPSHADRKLGPEYLRDTLGCCRWQLPSERVAVSIAHKVVIISSMGYCCKRKERNRKNMIGRAPPPAAAACRARHPR